jgi:hypothetical protein
MKTTMHIPMALQQGKHVRFSKVHQLQLTMIMRGIIFVLIIFNKYIYIMKKNLKSSDVINALTDKIQLKKDLRVAKKQDDSQKTAKISKQIAKIDKKLHSIPLKKS